MALDPALLAIVGARAAGKKRLPKAPRQLYPSAIEAGYRAALQKYVAGLRLATIKVLDVALPAVGSSSYLPRRADGLSEDMDSMLNQLTKEYDKLLPVLSPLTEQTANKANNFELNQWRKTMNAVLGVNLWQSEPWLQDSLKSWATQNTALITKLSDDLQGQIRTITQQGFLAGKRHETIRNEILGTNMKGLDHVPALRKIENRAKLIARDQISKLNGQLTSARQQQAGITWYVWRTAQDERVRESHSIMGGKLCRWDNPSVYSADGGKTWIPRPTSAVQLPPGQDYQCRCYAEPYFENILAAAAPVPISAPTTIPTRTEEQKRRRAERRRLARSKAKAPTIQMPVQVGSQYATLTTDVSQINSIKMLHYTDEANVEKILLGGFNYSENSMYTRGVYFTDKVVDTRKAIEITLDPHTQAVITKDVDVQRFIDEVTGKKHSYYGAATITDELLAKGIGSLRFKVDSETYTIVLDRKLIKVTPTLPARKVEEYFTRAGSEAKRFGEAFTSIQDTQALPALKKPVALQQAYFGKQPVGKSALGTYTPSEPKIGVHQDNHLSWVLNKDHDPVTTALHEMGHHVDYVLGRAYTSGSGFITYSDKSFTELSKRLRNSKSYKELRKALDTKKFTYIMRKPDGTIIPDIDGKAIESIAKIDTSTASHLEYLLRDHELFARAYMQYVATHPKATEAVKKAVGKTLTMQRKQHANVYNRYRQWDDDDFKPIAEAFDDIFKATHP